MTNIEDLPSNFVPGPGAYNIVPIRSSSPQFSMSSRMKELENKHILSVPAPGEYKIPGQFESPDKHGVTFGKRTTMLGLNNRVPGPGHYSPTTKMLRSNVQFTMSQRCKGPGTLEYDMKNKSAPSPNQYNLQSKLNTNGKITMKSRVKDIMVKPTSPGPAQYSPITKSSSMRQFSMSGRQSDLVAKHREKNSQLGPGSYNIPSSIKTTGGFSIRFKPKKRGVNAFCE